MTSGGRATIAHETAWSYPEVAGLADFSYRENDPAAETPPHAGHLRLMSDVTAAGAIIAPPCRPSTTAR